MNQQRFDAELRATVVRNLVRHAAADAAMPKAALKRAAVCVILTEDDSGRPAVLLTRRTSHLNAHAGQFAFPGGRMDEGETPLDAALRETREEIGMDLAPDAVLGRLDDYPTRSGYLITPLVAWAAGETPMQANPDEVAAIFRVPLVDITQAGSPEFVSIPESDRPVIRYPLLGTRIHAPTAAVLYQFMEVAILGRATPVAHLEQPVWAWR
jgi:8-oxo-dGTP pyrophosphatase MutT (NUDIX family)